MSPKTVLITGATRGIGRSCAELLTSKGYQVIATGTNPKALAELEQQGIRAMSLNMLDKDDIYQKATDIEREFGKVDCLINSAGVLAGGPIVEMSESDLMNPININFIGFIHLVRAFFPLLNASNGRLIQISSEAVNISGAFTGPYCMSKIAAESVCDSLRREWFFLDLDVVIIQPGAVKTDLLAGIDDQFRSPLDDSLFENMMPVTRKLSEEEKEKAIEPIAVAELALKIINTKNPKHRYLINQGFMRLLISKLPHPWMDFLFKKVYEGEMKKLGISA